MEEKTAIMKKITIYQGDEYRAKIEKKFQAEDIFANVYERAYKIVNEITHEMQKYKEENKKYSTRFAGLGNNIVIFCGARGQGKTSAMQSFSRCLSENKIPAFIKESETNIFEILDSIDPSAMENDESILRVLLSRLFYKFEEYMKGKSRDSRDIDKLQPIRAKVLELFQKCYENIDYIKSNRNRKCALDDLETLSRLGSSAELKKNLYDLIEQYFELCISDDEGKIRKHYLVVPVDDADLATKKVFQLCEDIRNYLSIPNVIILLAADYDQLLHATYQRYLKQHKMMWKTLPIKSEARNLAHSAGNVDKNNSIINDCYQMAARYLEKIFPSGHRINLPQIDYLLAESYENIKLDYREWDENGQDSTPVFLEWEKCENIQEQFIKLVYQRTGIVLVCQDEAMHTFLPHTFREITHFIKLLSDMNNIECDEIYQKYEKSSITSKELRENICQLKENILMLKQYFLYSWCVSNLNESEIRKIYELDGANKRNQMQKIKNIVHEIFKSTIEEPTLFERAVLLYDTILLNEWFAVALENEQQFDKIVQFVGTPLACSVDFWDKLYKKQYMINKFKIKADILEKILGADMRAAEITCLENFCVAMQEGKVTSYIEMIERTDEKSQLNGDIEELEFNILKPILFRLINKGARRDRNEEKKQTVESISDKDKDIDIDDIDAIDNTDSIEGQLDRLPYLITVRNIIANADMQIYLSNQLDLWYKELNRKRTLATQWIKIEEELYRKIGKLIEQKTYGIAKNEAVELYKAAYNRNDKFMSIIFLCNEENRGKYCQERRDTLIKCKADMDKALKNFDLQIKSTDEESKLKEVSLINNLLDSVEKKLNESLIKWEDVEEKGELLLGSDWSGLKRLQGEVNKKEKKLRELISTMNEIDKNMIKQQEWES